VAGNNFPASQTYVFDQTNVTGMAVVLTAAANEQVVVKELVFAGNSSTNINWVNETVAGSVRLYQSQTAGAMGVYQGTDVLVQGSRTFDGSGSVTFTNLSGLVTLVSGAPETLILVFDLKVAGITNKHFQETLTTTTVKASGQTTGQLAIMTGGLLTGSVHTVLGSTPTPTATDTSTVTNTFTSTPTPTSTFTLTHTITPTFTFTPHPASQLVLLGTPDTWTAGVDASVTLQVQNDMGQATTLASALMVSFTSDSGGEWSFTPASYPLLTGDTEVTVAYKDFRAGSPHLTVSALGLTSATFPVTVVPASAVSLQVLWPFETAVSGRPAAVPGGVQTSGGSPVTAGYPINATVRLVDSYFNLAPQNEGVTFSVDDAAAPKPASVQLASGSAQVPVLFVTPGNHTVTAGTSTLSLPTAHSSVLNVLGGSASTLLNVVHGAPRMTTVVKGQLGMSLMTFDLSIGAGTDPIQLDQFILNAVDAGGTPLKTGTAFSSLYLTDGSVTVTSSALDASSVTFAVPAWTWPVSYSTRLHLSLMGDISNAATVDNIRLLLVNASDLIAHDPVTLSSQNVGITSNGDSTGFPMRSSLLTLRGETLADTFGNYPNPFRAGLESTTIEFYLPSPHVVDLTIYDYTGRVVKHLLSNTQLPAGLQRIPWDGHNGRGSTVVNGVYFVRLTVDGNSLVIKTAVSK
jgi:hypothetical protein